MGLQRMYPKAAHLCSFNRGQGYGTHTAPGTSVYVDNGECALHVDDLYGALDETGYGAARSMGAAPNNNGQFEWIFGDPPQNITIASLTLVGWMRTSSANTAAIDTPPTVKFFVNPGGTRYYDSVADTIDRPINRNTLPPLGSFAKWSQTWVTNPATAAAWTRADLLSGAFKAGLASDGTNGSGIYPTTGGSAASFDVASFYIELDTTPTGLYVDPVRRAISHQLRMLRRALRMFTLEVPPDFCALEPGQTVWSSHDLLPWAPGLLSWQQVPLYLSRVEDLLSQRRRRLTFLDLRDQFASFWSPLQVTGVDAQTSGLAMIHRGGGWSTARNQVAYARRPGDGLYQQVAANAPLLMKDGLLVQGGSSPDEDKNWILNSTFSQGTGAVFTSWTNSTAGTGALAEDVLDYLIDTAGWQRSVKCSAPAASDTARVYQATGTITANTKVFVRLHYKNDSGTDAVKWRLSRAVDGWFWNDTTPGWQAGAVFNSLAVSSSIVFNACSQQIDVGGTNTTLELMVGLTTVAAAAVAHIYSAEVVTGTQKEWKRRSILPTTGATVVRTKDVTALDNSADFRVWNPSRGYFRVDVLPLFAHADLDDGDIKIILSGAHDGAVGAAGMHQAVGYKRVNSTTGTWFFDGAEYTPGSPALLPDGATWYTVAGRWTSVAEQEQGLSGQAYSIWVEGVKGGTQITGATEPGTPTTAAVVYLGSDSTYAGSSTFDGVLKNLTIDSRCPTAAEMERM